MNPHFYSQCVAPAFVLMAEPEARTFVFRLQCFPEGGVVRVIRGWHCQDYQCLHNEVAAALQFPDYYGENWDAMDECITDLEWAPGAWYLLQVTAVECLLPHDTDSLKVFLRVLRSAHAAWLEPSLNRLLQGRGSIPFHIVISGSPEGLAAFGRSYLRTSGPRPNPSLQRTRFARR